LAITLDFENLSNVDVPLTYQPVKSIGGAPMALKSSDLLGSQATEVQVPLLELDGPKGYLRAGGKGSVVIWVNYKSKPMVFLVEQETISNEK
jgi:hypothetical protein